MRRIPRPFAVAVVSLLCIFLLAACSSSRKLQRLTINPTSATIDVGTQQKFTAAAFYSNGTSADATSLVSWGSSPTSVATITTSPATTPGQASAIAVGTATITASMAGVTAPPATLNVLASGSPVPASLQITPSAPTAAVGNAVSFTAQEVWTDATLHTPSATVTWTSGTPATATIVASAPTYNALSAALAAGTTTITATEGTLTPGTTTLTVVTGKAHFAYVTNINSSTIQWFSVTATTSPYLTSQGTVGLSVPVQSFLNPSGQYLYALDSNSSLWVYNVDSSTGALTLAFPQPQIAGAGNANYGVADPYGRFLYVIDYGSGPGSTYPNGTIYGFTISQTDGSLTLISGAPFTANLDGPEFILIDHSGSYVYVVNYGNNKISAYTIDQTSGALTPLATGATTSTGNLPQLATLDPSGTHIYVANYVANGAGTVSGYSIGTGGVLTSIGADKAITGALSVINVAVDPSGKYLYVLDGGDDTTTPVTNGQLFGYNIGTGGVIGTALTGTPAATGEIPTGIAIDPTSSLIAVDNGGDGTDPSTISLFSIGTGGALTADTPVPAGVSPIFVIFYNAP